MAEISWTRRSYEATVLLIPLDRDARAWLGTRTGGDLDGIRIAGERPPDHAVHAADVVVLLVHDLAAADRDAVVQIGDAARLSGTLLGAVVVSPGARWEDPGAHRSAAAIREAADNVVILKDDRFVPAFLQVLRGGPRDGQDRVPA